MNLDIFLSPSLACVQNRKYDTYVVIDVFRATTAFCTAFEYGIKEIIPFADKDEAYKMREQGFLIAGEREGFTLEGFDFGNSPFGFMSHSLKGRSLAFTTTNGTKCIDMVKDKGELIIASYNNLSIVVNHLINKNKDVAIVCSGWKGMPCIEDTLCAGAIAEALLESGFTACEDSVLMARNLSIAAQGEELDFILKHSTRVESRIKMLEQDFLQCLKKDIYSVLPILKGKSIINYAL